MARTTRIPEPFTAYLKSIEADLRRGIATEYTYRSALEKLLESLADDIEASNDPKHASYGAPDFVVERRGAPLGYLETKDVGADLNAVERGEQLKRYRGSINNLVLTDYLEFRRYLDGQPREKARVATVGAGGRLTPNPAGVDEVAGLLRAFYTAKVPTVATPRELAERMARLTRLIRGLTLQELDDERDDKGPLHRQYAAFKALLLPGLTHEEFADIYAQTMAYGLFAARLAAPEGIPFDRASAYRYLRNNPFLRRLFLEVGEEFDGTAIAPFLDDIVALLNRADLTSILRDFGRRTGSEDPVVHFYETFLAAYDSTLRESRGVYYTPEPVVQFIVNSVDWLLREKFGRPWGLADESVHLLDPATGTGTFLYFVIRAIHATLTQRGQAGVWQGYVHERLLPRVFGFELLMAPYAIAHLKLGLLLEDLGYTWQRGDRLGVYLTNTLDEGALEARPITGLGDFIEEEAKHAAQVKHDDRIMVVIGNPPYSNFGQLNKNDWIDDLLDAYKKGLNEKKINLDDDFIKFIRFGQWRIDQTGQGILAFITNNTFIDGITHRQMRRSLMDSFTDIYILDLHGSARKKEVAPDGSKDENVFDIQQGVSIGLFVKEPGKSGPARVHHAELWGTRTDKYQFLAQTHIGEVNWDELQPKQGRFAFVPDETVSDSDSYLDYPSIVSAFPTSVSGIQTGRDEFVSRLSDDEFQQWLKLLESKSATDDEIGSGTVLPIWNGFDLDTVREKIRDPRQREAMTGVWLYRPFDLRPILYDAGCIKRPRGAVMAQLQNPNLGLITVRQLAGNSFNHVFVTTHIGDGNTISLNTREYNYYLPLYIYTTPDNTADTLFAQTETTRTPNLAPDFVRAFAAKLGLAFISDGAGDLTATFGPEDVFHYAYAVFHAPTYRSRYAEFLKIDFPRLPLTSDRVLFAALVAKGRALVGLHLLTSPAVENFITGFPVAGDNTVEKVRYAAGRVWINAKQYFDGVPEAVWAFKVGGYQVCDKWLKDRKGRTLTHDDINHYQRVVVALRETIRLMAEIDATIPAWPIT